VHFFTNWLGAGATFSLILLLVGFGFLEIQHTRHPKKAAQENENPTGNRSSGTIPQHAVARQKHPNEEEHRSAEQAYWDRHIEAQSRRDYVGWVALGLSALATLGTILNFYEAGQQAEAASQANAINRNASVYFGNTFHIRDIIEPDGNTGQAIVFKIGNSGGSSNRGRFAGGQAVVAA